MDIAADFDSSFIVSFIFGLMALVYAVLKFIKDLKAEKADTHKDSSVDDLKELEHRVNNIAERLARVEGKINHDDR